MNILDQIKKQSAERAVTNPVKAQPEKVDLRGSGLNQKFLTKAQNEIRRQEKAAMGSAEAEKARLEAEANLHELVDAETAQMQADYTKGVGIVFDDSQEAALEGLLTNQFAVMIGPAGSGKTTLTKEFVNRLLQIIPLSDVWFGAFTGRACQQIRRALPPQLHTNVSTIHSLLEYAPTEEEYEYPNPFDEKEILTGTRTVFRPQRDATNQCRQKVYIFDEGGMIGCNLWNEFIAACPRDARIIIIGDIHQLPPVMDKSVLGFAMNIWPVFELKKIHRQSEGNAIIDNAHRVLHGETLKNASNFHLLGGEKCPSGSGQMQLTAVQWLKKLADLKKFDPIRDAFIVPQNKGMIGQLELNPHLLMLFNPPREENGIIVNKRFDIHTGTDRAALAVGDKVMVTSNINTVSPPITNGMIGLIEEINLNGKYDQKRSQFVDGGSETVDLGDLDAANFADTLDEIEETKVKDKDISRDQRQASHITTIKFESGQTLACNTAGDYRRIMHSYAITCHKAQGGEYPNVVILLHSANATMLYQEWLYTAITRARENVYIFYNNRGMKLALDRQRIKGKTLQEKIKAYNIEAKTDELAIDKRPVLWAPKKVREVENV